MATVGEAVQERRGEPGITEDLSPAGKVQIAGDQYRAPLVAVGKETEEQLGARLGERDEPDLIQDEEVKLEKGSFQKTVTILEPVS